MFMGAYVHIFLPLWFEVPIFINHVNVCVCVCVMPLYSMPAHSSRSQVAEQKPCCHGDSLGRAHAARYQTCSPRSQVQRSNAR